MGRLRVVLSWAFVRGPAAAYELADSGSSLFGIGGVLVLVVLAALGSGIGALVGLIAHRPVGDAVFVGGMIGIGIFMAWLVLMVVVVAVLWVRGLSPADAASGEKLAGRHAARGYGWRRPGEPLVPGSLVLFFALMTLAFGSLGLHARQVSRPWDGPTATTSGTVVSVHEPAWFEKGSGSVDIRYTVAGVEHVIETGRDPGEHVLALGEVVPVEYDVAEPAKARSTWAVESARSDATFWLWLGGGCGVLGLLSGAGWLGGRLRSSGRRGG
ncbi:MULTISPECIES: DUF3592 domain-containing protein [Kribbella]|uniref:DUF3592 domain-containing protein n=1 Tax=Kribbella TaxID=182639 RepID=UPI0010634683|nr:MULTISPECIES: DUF3592 domain-containing protein [Kribbella]